MPNKKTDSQVDELRFEGFGVPESNYFKMPNEWTDITAKITSLAELKVVEYVLKHTWGYREFGIAKTITTDEFMNGRKRRDGTRVDLGTGLSNRSVIDGLRRAVADGLLVEKVDDSDRARIKKSYALRMRSSEESNDSDVKNLHIGLKNLHSSYEESPHRSEKDTLATVAGQPRKKDNNNSGGDPDPKHGVVVALSDLGISKAVAKRLASRYSRERILEKMDYLAFLQETDPKRAANPRGWLRRAIEEDFGPPDGYKPREERDREATAQISQEEELALRLHRQEEKQRRQLAEREAEYQKRLAQLQAEYGTTETELALWRQVLTIIATTTPRAMYEMWLAHTQLLSLQDEVAIIGVPNQAAREWLSARLQTVIMRAFQTQSQPVRTLEFVILKPGNGA